MAATGYYLLDHRNPHGDHFYVQRRGRVKAITVHITAGLEDLEGLDLSAERTAQYCATTEREVSWHGGSDTDSFLYLLPPEYLAWHVEGYNTHTYGWEISKAHPDWRPMPRDWVERTLTQAANGLRPIARALGIPARWATREEVDHAIRTDGPPVGFVDHAALQPRDRLDPGMVQGVNTFPRARFLELVRGDAPRRYTEGADSVLIQNLDDPGKLTATLSGGIVSQVNRDSAEATNRAANLGLMIGLDGPIFEHHVKKSVMLERAAALQPEILEELRANRQLLTDMLAELRKQNGTQA